MNDPRVPQYSNYSSTWGGGQQSPSSSNYSYQHGVRDVDLPHHQTGYGGMESPQIDAPYQEDYYATSPSYQHPSATVIQPTAYHSTSSAMSSTRDPQSPHRSGHYHSHSQSHPHTMQSPYSQVPSQSQPVYARPKSNFQVPTHVRAQTLPTAIPQPPSHYPSQAISISPQYPASPTRPFTCDLCTLSFNRQHDLKRHRETHTGEKPYLCNGGCGKTFTRKDALKRHQLVKQCGKVDEAWA
ncbi:hypothetical protein C0995_006262 [Termitomyces sp. Mi166|nr:hypothetical protein C0995_006262 [Termitomyces sp. Mi166\